MAISLYDATVLDFLQTVGGIEGVLQKGLAHCKANGIDPKEMLETRLYPDMLPLSFQIASVVNHSVRAIECVQAGIFTRPPQTPALDYAGFQKWIDEAIIKLKSYTADEVNALEGKEMSFQAGNMDMRFTAQDFLPSFSLPNLHFHAATAYGILRHKGVPLGKRDYLGKLRAKS